MRSPRTIWPSITAVAMAAFMLVLAAGYRTWQSIESSGVVGDAPTLRASNLEVVQDLGTVFTLPDVLWLNGKEILGQGEVHKFSLENDTGENVRIVDVKTSCGCIAAKLDDSVLPPHGRTSLSVGFVAEKVLDGARKSWVVLQTDGGATWRYGVAFQSVRAVTWSRNEIYFGDASGVPLTETVAELLLTRPAYLKDLSLKEVTCSTDLVEIRVEPGTTHSQNGMLQQRIPVHLSLTVAGVLSGSGSTQLTARYSAGGREYQAVANVRWARSSPYVSEPGRLVVQRGGQVPQTLTVKVSHAAGLPFRIVSSTLPEYLTLDAGGDEPASATHQLLLRLDIGRLPRIHDFRNIVLQTDAERDNTISIPVTYIHLTQSKVAASSESTPPATDPNQPK